MLRAPQTHVRVYARLVPMTVMAREAREVVQFQPLLAELAAKSDAASQAMLHLLQVVRGLFKGRHDGLWSALLTQASGSLQREFAWELAALTLDILDRAQGTRQPDVIDNCALVGRRLLHWVWSERSQGATAFLDNVGGIWGVRLVCRTYAREPNSARDVLKPILEQLSNPAFPIEYFSRLTDEVPHVWGVDPDLATDIYAAAFSHEEKSDAKTAFGTPILPLTSTRRQDFSMCQYHLIRHYKGFLAANAIAASRAALRALNQYVIGRHVVRFLNPGFTIEDVTERFQFRGGTSLYVRDLSYSWEAGHRDEPIEIADQLFRYIDEIATAGDVASIDALLDVFATEARCAFFWKRLLESGSRAPTTFAERLFELAMSEPVFKNSETLQALGAFLEAASPYFDADQRVAIERRVLALTDETTNEEERERSTHRRNRLLSRLPSALLATDEAKQARRQLEEQSGLVENRPLVRFESGWGAYSEEQWLRDQGVGTLVNRNHRISKLSAVALGGDEAPPRLWTPPTYRYYRDDGFFGEAPVRKVLVFSGWRFVPKAVAVITSQIVTNRLGAIDESPTQPLRFASDRLAFHPLDVCFPSVALYGLRDTPIDGLYVHPKSGLIRDQRPWRTRRSTSSAPR